MAHNIGLIVVAEGVETLGNINALRAMKCDEFQGYITLGSLYLRTVFSNFYTNT
jgi:EAL domain-containing protein (putative c-di-GMP-specific phosphodiesterase class I)